MERIVCVRSYVYTHVHTVRYIPISEKNEKGLQELQLQLNGLMYETYNHITEMAIKLTTKLQLYK